MGWLDDWLTDLGAPAPPIAKPQPEPELKSVWFQTHAPRDGDLGEVEVAYYSVADGVLTMHSEKGVPTGKEYQLRPDDDPHQVAGRMARKVWRDVTPDFNRPLGYARGGYA